MKESQIEKAALLLSAMSNPTRLKVLEILTASELPVGELAVRLGVGQSALSQHLSKLRAAKLVKTRRDAQTVYYSSTAPEAVAVLDVLESLLPNKTTTRMGAGGVAI